MKIKKKALEAAYKELDKVIGGIVPPIEYDDLTDEEFAIELHEVVTGVDEEDGEPLIDENDKFTKKTQSVFDALIEEYGEGEAGEAEEEEEEEPAPKKKGKGKKKPEPEEEEEEEEEDDDDDEDEEDDDDEDEEDDDDEEEEEVEDVSLVTTLDDITKKDDLLDVIENNKAQFKGFKAKKYKKAKELRKAMIEHLSTNPGRPEDDRKDVPKKKAPAPRKVKGMGVVATIAQLVTDAGKKGISKADILATLVETFPERAEKSMKSTVNLHIPGLMSKERFPVERIEGTDLYRKAGEAAGPKAKKAEKAEKAPKKTAKKKTKKGKK